MRTWSLTTIQEFILTKEISVPCAVCCRLVFYKPCLVMYPTWNDITSQFDVTVMAEAFYSGQSCACPPDLEHNETAKKAMDALLNVFLSENARSEKEAGAT